MGGGGRICRSGADANVIKNNVVTMETHREPEDVRLPAGQVLVPLMGGGVPLTSVLL